jgi:Bacterial PH domain
LAEPRATETPRGRNAGPSGEAALVRPGRREELRLEARRHGIVLVRPFLEAMLAAALGTILLLLGWPFLVGGAVGVAAGAFLALRAVWRWERTRLVVTSEKLLLTGGTVRRWTAAVPLRSLAAIEIEQTLPGRILGYGTLVAGPLEVDHVPRPEQVSTLLQRLAA